METQDVVSFSTCVRQPDKHDFFISIHGCFLGATLSPRQGSIRPRFFRSWRGDAGERGRLIFKRKREVRIHVSSIGQKDWEGNENTPNFVGRAG